MYKDVLQSIHDIEIWPIISLVLFFIVFIGMLIYVFKIKKQYIDEVKNLPLDEGDESLNAHES